MVDQGSRIKVKALVQRRVSEVEARLQESFTLALWRATDAFIGELFQRSDFDGPRPTGLNRHWILHGRDETAWNQADSLRLFQATDTITSLQEKVRSRPEETA